MSLIENIESIKKELSKISLSSGGNPQLVLVSKKVSKDVVQQAYDLGVRDFGENRVQDLLDKKESLPEDIRWHFIGHLQTNKVKFLLDSGIALIHSIDSIRLAKEIEKVSRKFNNTTDVLLQVNIAQETSKFGFNPSEVEDAVAEIFKFGHVRIKGLMAMAPFVLDKEQIRSCFLKLRELRDRLCLLYPDIEWKELSMGMSEDYKIALEEGATIIRLGAAVFGKRREL